MKIDPDYLPEINRDLIATDRASGSGRVAGADAKAGAKPAEASKGDGLELSAAGGRFRELRSRLETPGRAQRVGALKALVANGQYQVDGQQVAQALLADEPTSSLLGRPPSR